MSLVEYSSHFWGDKHIGYHVLYENMRKNEDVLAEFSNFVRERAMFEEESLKFLNKTINRINNITSNNGAFVYSWRLTKAAMELWSEVQMSILKYLNEISRDLERYHSDMIKQRKRVSKDAETIEAVNLMQTTTTCLQKTKETYAHRCAELQNLKSESVSTKDYLKAKNKLGKAHDEYRSYVEKYSTVRVNFEEKMLAATRAFQENDHSFLNQLKTFFIQFSESMEKSYSSMTSIIREYKHNLEEVDIEEIMMRFIEEKGTGIERPPPLKWQEADDPQPPVDFEIISTISGSAQSSSNSSAIVQPPPQPENVHTVDDLLGLDDFWSLSSKRNYKQRSESTLINQITNAEVDSGSDEKPAPQHSAAPASSHMPQISSWLSRQKLSHWRKKYSASHSNLPALTGDVPLDNPIIDLVSISSKNSITSSTAASSSKSMFLKRYQKNGVKSGGSEKQKKLCQKHYAFSENPPIDTFRENGNKPKAIISNQITDPLEEFGPPPPLPNTDPPPLLMDDISITFSRRYIHPEIHCAIPCHNDKDENSLVSWENHSLDINQSSYLKRPLSSSSSSSDDEENRASKLKLLHIRPLNETSSASKLLASVDELKAAVGHLTLPRSSTLDQDPWSSPNSETQSFSESQDRNILKTSFTGDEHMRKKRFTEYDALNAAFSELSEGFENSFNIERQKQGIARARPRSSVPFNVKVPEKAKEMPETHKTE